MQTHDNGSPKSGRLTLLCAAILGLSFLGLDIPGCDGKDSDKCAEGQAGVRASLKAGDQALVDQWRTYAFKYCESGEFTALDREIQETLTAKKKAEAEKAKAKAANLQLVNLFVGWVGANKANPAGAAATVSCDGGEKEEKSQERWCVRTRMAGPHQLHVRYWEKEPTQVTFSAQIPEPITCEALGPHVVKRSWAVQGTIQRHHCSLTGGAAAGMEAMVTEAKNATLHIFTPQYVERNEALKRQLSGG